MPSLYEFPPLRTESIDSIRARVDADVNAGIDPNTERFNDTTPGGFYWDLSQAVLLEVARVWDFAATEVPCGGLHHLLVGRVPGPPRRGLRSAARRPVVRDGRRAL